MVCQEEVNLFEVFVKYHIGNLERGLAKRDEGEAPVRVGVENHREWYKGAIMFANGADLVDLLLRNRVIKKNAYFVYEKVRNNEDLTAYLDKLAEVDVSDEGEVDGIVDGAMVYDRESRQVATVKLNNSSPCLEEVVAENTLPNNFLSEDGSYPLIGTRGSHVGTRSELAFTLSRGVTDQKGKSHEIHAYMIKHTSYNELGFGPVVHMGKDRMELFFFRQEENAEGRYIDPEHKIVGVCRSYTRQEGKPFTLDKEMYVLPGENGKLKYLNC